MNTDNLPLHFRKLWSIQGARAYATNTTPEGHTVTLTGRPPSCHVKISAPPDCPCMVRRIVFGKPRERLIDQENEWGKSELLTAFGIRRHGNSTNDYFARRHEAKYGLPGKFLRIENFLILLRALKDEPNIPISVYLTEDIKRQVSRLLLPFSEDLI